MASHRPALQDWRPADFVHCRTLDSIVDMQYVLSIYNIYDSRQDKEYDAYNSCFLYQCIAALEYSREILLQDNFRPPSLQWQQWTTDITLKCMKRKHYCNLSNFIFNLHLQLSLFIKRTYWEGSSIFVCQFVK